MTMNREEETTSSHGVWPTQLAIPQANHLLFLLQLLLLKSEIDLLYAIEEIHYGGFNLPPNLSFW